MGGRSIDVTTVRRRIERDLTVPVVTVWGFVVGATLAPQIVANEILGIDPGGLLLWQLVALLGLFVVTLRSSRLRQLRSFAIALFFVQIGIVVDWSTVNAVVSTGITGGFLAWFGHNALKMAMALAMVLVMVALGYDREDLYLRRGSLSRPFDPVALPGLDERRPWRWYALRWGGGILLVTVVVTIGLQGNELTSTEYAPGQLVLALPLTLLAAAFNAFYEEFLFRAGPIAELADLLGKHHALLVLGTVWGVNHFYGTPSGVPAIVMGIVGGWFIGKSVLETRGIGFAGGLHVLLDLVVFL
jgi:hypothetical protein